MSKYVVYSNDEETIVSTIEDEHIVLKEYFEEGKRITEDYNRTTSNGPVSIAPKLAVRQY